MDKLKEDDGGGGGAVGTAGGASTNVMGNSSSKSGTGGIDTFDPLIKFKKPKKLRDIMTRRTLEDIRGANK